MSLWRLPPSAGVRANRPTRRRAGSWRLWWWRLRLHRGARGFGGGPNRVVDPSLRIVCARHLGGARGARPAKGHLFSARQARRLPRCAAPLLWSWCRCGVWAAALGRRPFAGPRAGLRRGGGAAALRSPLAWRSCPRARPQCGACCSPPRRRLGAPPLAAAGGGGRSGRRRPSGVPCCTAAVPLGAAAGARGGRCRVPRRRGGTRGCRRWRHREVPGSGGIGPLGICVAAAAAP